MAFYSEIIYWGNGNAQTLLGLLDLGSELILIPRDLKCHCGSTYEGQLMINGVLSKVQPILGPLGRGDHSVLISLISECIIGIGVVGR